MKSREIKFRVWADGTMYTQDNGHFTFGVNEHKEAGKYWSCCEYKTNEYFCDSTDGSILMQYTGLKDKNGKEIYEGDIVRCGTVGIIKFLDGRFIYDYEHPEDPEQLDVIEVVTGEVIGNIYENS